MEFRPTLLQLFRRDSLAWIMSTFIGLFSLALFVIAFARGPVTGEHDPVFSGIFVGFAALMLVACGCWVLCRLLCLRRLLVEGIRVTGNVLRVDSVVDGGWYTAFGYHLDGRAYRVVIGSPSDPRYQMGERVALLVDPRKPSRAIIEAKYANR